jgi:5-methylcytosine-specific restriction endonuclease McrA
MTADTAVKRCTKCGRTLPLDAYHVHRRGAQGRRSACRECTRAENARWQDTNREGWYETIRAWKNANPERVKAQARKDAAARRADGRSKEQSRRWRAAHPERAREVSRLSQRRRRAADPEASNAKSAAWRAANPTQVHAGRHRRRMREDAADQRSVTPAELRRIRSLPCAACGTFNDVVVDHIVPLSRGGRDAIGNLAALCRSHNASKRELTWTEWRASGRPGVPEHLRLVR